MWTLQKLAKTNVQTTLCDRREPANASSLYLALTLPFLSLHPSNSLMFRKQRFSAASLQTGPYSCVSHGNEDYIIDAHQ
jgi:hypothetical protein